MWTPTVFHGFVHCTMSKEKLKYPQIGEASTVIGSTKRNCRRGKHTPANLNRNVLVHMSKSCKISVIMNIKNIYSFFTDRNFPRGSVRICDSAIL